jgi:hypothetical protein
MAAPLALKGRKANLFLFGQQALKLKYKIPAESSE